MASTLNLVQIVQSFPVRIRFAGFESNTHELQRNGWQISAEQRSLMSFSSLQVTLLLKHEGLHLYGLSQPISVDHIELIGGHPFKFYEKLKQQCFDVVVMSKDIKVRHEREATPWRNFLAVDCEPQLVTLTESMLSDFKLFRPLPVDASEIIIDVNDTGKLMDRIIELQNPKQKEIRDRVRKERLRDGLEGYNTDYIIEQANYRPARDIHLQIVTAA